MQIDIENSEGIGIITVRDSQLDHSNYEEFISRINSVLDKTPNIILDLQNLDFIDSSGLSSFAHILRRSREMEGRFRVCSVGEAIQDAFDLAHIDRVVDIFGTREDAVGSFSQ